MELSPKHPGPSGVLTLFSEYFIMFVCTLASTLCSELGHQNMYFFSETRLWMHSTTMMAKVEGCFLCIRSFVSHGKRWVLSVGISSIRVSLFLSLQHSLYSLTFHFVFCQNLFLLLRYRAAKASIQICCWWDLSHVLPSCRQRVRSKSQVRQRAVNC